VRYPVRPRWRLLRPVLMSKGPNQKRGGKPGFNVLRDDADEEGFFIARPDQHGSKRAKALHKMDP